MHADLQRLLADELLTDFGAKPMERLRDIRSQLTRAEGDVSLVRRMTQGRMDIVGHEVERRSRDRRPASADDPGSPAATGEPPSPSPPPADPAGSGPLDGLSDLLFDMPTILTDERGGVRAGRGGGRAVAVAEPGPVAMELIERLDAIVAPGELARIAEIEAPALGDLFEGMREFELELSSTRRTLHDRIDAIQDEIARRYRDGEASVDALLS